MIGDPSNLITVTWSTLDGGDGRYVCEFTDGQLSLTFGPMPPEVVAEFIADRKKQVEEIFDRALEKLNGQNSPDKNEPLADQALPER